jgi:hypothetical protein
MSIADQTPTLVSVAVGCYGTLLADHINVYGAMPAWSEAIENAYRTDPDVTVIAVMLSKLPAAVEIIGIDRSVVFSDLGLPPTFFLDRFF